MRAPRPSLPGGARTDLSLAYSRRTFGAHQLPVCVVQTAWCVSLIQGLFPTVTEECDLKVPVSDMPISQAQA